MTDLAPYAATVMGWHAQGLSVAEIGHRLGLSPDALREVLAEAGVKDAELEPACQDDDQPNDAPVR
ncbi:MAG: hypothetical protein ACXW3D_11625 [Caulobacteraceae bacterium]